MPALKARPEHPDLARAGVGDQLERPVELLGVAGQDRVQHRQVEVQAAALVAQRPHVLGQAGAAEGEAGAQVDRGQVELGVGAEDVHDALAVEALGLGQAADLVGEAHLEGVPGVVGVLDHLGQLQVGLDQRRPWPRRHRGDQVADLLVDGADDDLGRLVVVADGGALAQELGVHGDRDRPAGGALQVGQQDLAGRAGQDGAADHHHDRRPLAADGLADVVGHPAQVAEVEAAVALAGRADADEGEVGPGDRLVAVGGGPQAAGPHALGDELAQAGLDHRASGPGSAGRP